MQNVILEIAKVSCAYELVMMMLCAYVQANYYYMNNTKEFGALYVLDTMGTNRVSGAIASVSGVSDEVAVYNELILRKYPSLRQQVPSVTPHCVPLIRLLADSG